MVPMLFRVWTTARILLLELVRRKDVYVALFLAIFIVVPVASVNVFGVEGIVRYLTEISLLLCWLISIFITVATASRQMPTEIQSRTIYPLLAKPISRSEVVLGKFLGSTLASAAAISAFYLLLALLTVSKQGAGGLNLAVFLQAWYLHLLFCALLTAVTLLGSLYFTPGANVTVSTILVASMLLFGARLPNFAEPAGHLAPVVRGIHLLAPHFEFFDLRTRLIHHWEPLHFSILLAITAYAAIYVAILLFGACQLFKRKGI